MAEQKQTPNASNRAEPLYPVEGREDVANSVEEEQRNAYSAHPHAASTPKSGTTRQQSGASSAAERAELPPVEGREDVAKDVEEEQRNAYSSKQQ